MHWITRIAYNTSGWQRPTGEAKDIEAGTYNREYGFGHEDWLFRSEWMIDGWRYAFIQGVNKSHAAMVRRNEAFDLTVFTIDQKKRRRYVATIKEVECLDDRQANDALEEFTRRGWLRTMSEEIAAVKGDPKALGMTAKAKHILNVRFRQHNVDMYPHDAIAKADDRVMRLNRYQLSKVDEESPARGVHARGGSGSSSLPIPRSVIRRGSGPVECSPEHARMQAKLMQELQGEFPEAEVVREHDFVDVTVRDKTGLMLFEIKSDLEPRSVIRLALGQLLEYAFHPARNTPAPRSLVIVGRRRPSTDDERYLSRLRDDFNLPLEYRTVPL